MGEPRILHRTSVWNDAGDHKETAGERKVKMERGKIHRKKNLLQGVLQMYIIVSYLKMFRFKNLTLTVEQTITKTIFFFHLEPLSCSVNFTLS